MKDLLFFSIKTNIRAEVTHIFVRKFAICIKKRVVEAWKSNHILLKKIFDILSNT